MSAVDVDLTVAGLVTERPARSRAFERLGIDYCCGGGRSLASACAERGLDVAEVVRELLAADEPGKEGEPDWAGAPLGELCDHIVERHHSHLREELPRLSGLIEKVVRAHGRGQPELAEVQRIFEVLRAELDSHLAKEEGIVFAACSQLDTAGGPVTAVISVVPALVEHMGEEHESAAQALVEMRGLTSGYAPPATACMSYRAMLDGLAELEADLHLHIHKENNILFPRALALAKVA